MRVDEAVERVDVFLGPTGDEALHELEARRRRFVKLLLGLRDVRLELGIVLLLGLAQRAALGIKVESAVLQLFSLLLREGEEVS